MSLVVLPRIALGLFFAGGLALAACSSATEEAAPAAGDAGAREPRTSVDGKLPLADADGGALDTAAVARLYARGYCAFAERCYPGALRTTFGDVEKCVALYGADAEPKLLAHGVQLTKAALDACAASAATRSCSERLEDGPACRFKGTLPDGAGCVHSVQCGSGSCARPNGGCGVCKPAVGVGEDCSKAACDANLLCTAERKCVAYGDADDACDSTKQLYCKPGLSCVAAKCTKTLEAGATCTAGAGNPACSSGTTCVDGVCKGVKTAKIGEPCGTDPTTKEVSVCSVSQCVDGTCVALAKAGESCSYTAPTRNCEYGATCLPQQYPADAGSVCTFFPNADPNDCR